MLENDSDPEGEVLTLSSFSQPGHGTIVDNADGTLTYSPHVDFTGSDSFLYTITDEGGGSSTATVSINVTDLVSRISINDVSQVESNEDYVFTISLDHPPIARVDFDVITDLDTVPLYFEPGERKLEIMVNIPDNNIVEYDREFDVTISNVTTSVGSVTLGKFVGRGTIFDDDTATLSINDVSQFEDYNDGEYVFTISLSNPVDAITSFVVYSDFDSTTLVMEPLVTETTYTIVYVEPNNIVEFDGEFDVQIASLSTGGLPVTLGDSSGLGTILDDDFADIAITDVTMTEGDNGTTEFVFTVSLTNPVDDPIEVDFATIDGTATTANGDYQSASGTLRFEPLVTSQTITVRVNGDTTLEGGETFTVELDNLVFDEFLFGAVIIGDAIGNATIRNRSRSH